AGRPNSLSRCSPRSSCTASLFSSVLSTSNRKTVFWPGIALHLTMRSPHVNRLARPALRALTGAARRQGRHCGHQIGPPSIPAARVRPKSTGVHMSSRNLHLAGLAASSVLAAALGGCIVEAPPPHRYYVGPVVEIAPPPPRFEEYGPPPEAGYVWLGG